MIDLHQFDDAFAAAFPVQEAAAIPKSSVIFNGIYTLRFPCGTHRTFRIFTKKETAKFAPGQRIVAMLIGPNNDSFSNYESFAFCDDNGIRVWKSFKGKKQAEYAELLWMLATGCEADGYELLVSRRCLRCNRTLTTVQSIEAGIGPECMEKLRG